MTKRIISTLLAIITFATISCTTVFATTSSSNAVLANTQEVITVRQGGINSIDGKTCKTKEETIALEAEIRTENYICVSSKDMDISEDEYNLFCTGKLAAVPHIEYADKKNEFNWTYYKIYVYKPCYDEAMKQIKVGSKVDDITRSELGTSTVVIDFATWYQKERIGTVVNEYNNNIPSSYDETGFLQISSPIDVIVKIEYYYTHTYDEFYVRANKPLLIKEKTGAFIVNEVNTTKIPEKEEVLPFNNNIQIQASNTESDPYKIDLQKTIDKYKIAPANLDGKPDCSYKGENKPSEISSSTDKITSSTDSKITSESAVVKDTEGKVNNSGSKALIIILAVLIPCVLVGLFIFKKKK